MHHYDFHIGDYMKATAHLSNEEDLCYRRLLDMYYDTEQPIPKETDWVSRRLRIGSQVVLSVLQDFFILQEDGWHSLRCDEEIKHYKAICQRNREVGKLGGRPKKTQTVSKWNRLETDPNPNHEPVTSNHLSTLVDISNTRSRKHRLPADFYPNELGVAKAEQAGFSVAVELDKFRDFHNGKGNTMLDWQAAWRTWISNAVKFGKGKAHGQQSRFDALAQSAAELTGAARSSTRTFEGTAVPVD